MCAYARDVLTGRLPGPYTDQDARRYTCACLIPAELLERPALDLQRAARGLRIPVGELRAARDEHHAALVADWLLPAARASASSPEQTMRIRSANGGTPWPRTAQR
jgi:hypothetical protein